MKRAVFALLIVLGIPAVAFSAPKEKEEKKADSYDPENIVAISQYMDTVAKGAEKHRKGEHSAAIDLFKKAIALAPKNPLAHLLLGESYLAANNLPEAEAAFLAAQEASAFSDAKGQVLRSHVLFAVADCYERADSGAHPATAAARLELSDQVLAREKAYVAVRERIAAEKSDGGVKPDAGSAKK